MKLLKRGVVTLLFLVGIFTLFLVLPGPNHQNQEVIIENGSSYQVAKELKQKAVLREPYSFWLCVQMLRFMGYIQAGQYLFEPYTSPLQVILKMIDGDVMQHKITIPEGIYTSQVLDIIKAVPYLKGEVTYKFAEGSLFPSTYYYKYGYTRDYMLIQMKTSMLMNLKSMWDRRDKNLQLKNINDALILASIVEKETEHDDERAQVAAVFLNRLKKGMKLQADPTTIYAITNGEYVLKRPLTKKDLSIKSPYNTYYVYGLPPTPICNPGIESIQAVMNPAKIDALYFVLNDQGKHSFSSNYKDHKIHVQKFRELSKKLA